MTKRLENRDFVEGTVTMETSRLDSVAPGLAKHLWQALPAKQRQAVLVACEQAVASAGLTEQTVGQALDILRGNGAPDPSLQHRLESVAAEFDDEYFRLSEGDPAQRQDALRLFSRARATSALALALSGEDVHETIYEAIVATGEPSNLVRMMDDILGLGSYP